MSLQESRSCRVDRPTPEAIQRWPAAVDLVRAGTAFGLGRSLSYDLARRNEFPVPLLRIGRAYRARRSDICARLGIADPASISGGSAA